MFITQNKVRMHDTDMAGVIFFAKQFRYAHDALEEFMLHLGISFDKLFHDDHFVFVIVHAEADYLAPLRVGDNLDIHVSIENVGSSSFTVFYQIYRKSDQLFVGTAKTVHVTLDSKTRQKIPIPAALKFKLQQHKV